MSKWKKTGIGVSVTLTMIIVVTMMMMMLGVITPILTTIVTSGEGRRTKLIA